jgi:ABC-2 type transport system ATP-binding protein
MVAKPPPPPPVRPLPSGASSVALELEYVTKWYGPTCALNNVSFRVPAGQVVGLLGPNGAGKSTAMKSILGILRPEGGRIRVCGLDVSDHGMEVKRLSGYVPEAPALYEFLTGAEYLDFVADLYGMEPASRSARLQPFLAALELVGHENALISGYSHGMKQKIALIAALAHRPRLLVLDEALNGLDPRSARLVKDLLRSLASEGVGILFSTHVLEIAQAICDRVVILHHGTVLAEGTVEELRGRSGTGGSGLEEVFLSLTGSEDLRETVQALAR